MIQTVFRGMENKGRRMNVEESSDRSLLAIEALKKNWRHI